MPQHGDEAELFAAYNDELVRKVRRDVNTSLSNVEDACAMAWAQFLHYQPDRNRSWRGWLYRVATREAVRLDRLERSHLHLREVDEPDQPDARAAPPDPRTDLAQKRVELGDALAMLSRVPARRREAAV